MTKDTQNEDIDHFEHWSATYEDSRLQRFFFNRVHKLTLTLAAQFTPDPRDVLDVGCGTGRLLRHIQLKWPQARLTGVDPAKGMLEVAKRLTQGVTFHLGQGEILPIPDNSMDLVVSTISFHHWKDQATGVRELSRVTRPGGCVILTDFSLPHGLLWVFRVKRVHNKKEMQGLFTQAGLQVQAQKSNHLFPILATAGIK